MIPNMHPLTAKVALLLASIDYVADRLSPVPPSTHLFLNNLWTYGRRPPLLPNVIYDEDEAHQLGWAEAIYTPGMEYILGQMRVTGEPETEMRWFHDAVYIASLYCFNLFVLSEADHLPESLHSNCFSDVYDVNIRDGELHDFCNACVEALGQDKTFLTHFEQAGLRFEKELSSDLNPIWPPFNGVTRSGAEEWFL